ncbi:MAG TPA: MlaD family protein [Methylophilaceae bacterium]|jgi:paraquat-inducible protein B
MSSDNPNPATTGAQEGSSTGQPLQPSVSHGQRWLPSLVWLIPIVAALVGIILVFKIIMDRGPTITVSLRTAEGLQAGKSKVKYKDVEIGEVQAIKLSPDRSEVLVTIQLSKDARSFTASDTTFWIVRPRVDASGISGLGTLFSGAYIGADAGKSEETSRQFTGMESQPIVTRDAAGKQFILHAQDIGSLDIGSPVFYRMIKVGRVASYNLDEDGRGISLHIFVDAPYDKFVGLNTRFWHASGINLEINSDGIKVNTLSLASLAVGGLAFQSVDDDTGTLANENTVFDLADNQSDAFQTPNGVAETAVLYFNQSLRGLSPGAPVDFRGVVIGKVKSLGIDYDSKRHQFQMPVVVEIYSDRLGRKYNEDQQSSSSKKQRLKLFIDNGMRAQLRTGSLITGQLYVAIDFFPNAPKVQIDINKEPLELPTMPGSLDELQTQIATIAGKLSKVPFDQIGAELNKTLINFDVTLQNAQKLTQSLHNDVAPEIIAAMKDVRTTLHSAEQTLHTADITLSTAQRSLAEDAPLQQDLRQTFQDLSRAAVSLKVLTDYLEQHPESLIRGKPAEPKNE